MYTRDMKTTIKILVRLLCGVVCTINAEVASFSGAGRLDHLAILGIQLSDE